MKKNGTSSILTSKKPKHEPETFSNSDEDEDSLATTEELDLDDDTIENPQLLESILVDTVFFELKQRYDTLQELIILLSLHKDPRTDKLANYLSDSGIEGRISPKSLFNTFMNFIIEFIKPIKLKKGEDKQAKTMKQINDIKFYLSVFNFTPNTTVTEKKNKKEGLNILMLVCENKKNPFLLALLIHDPNADLNELSQDGRRYSALHIACEIGNLTAVKLLVEAGADINQGKFTPLGLALNEKHHKIVQFLLSLKEIDITKLSGQADHFLLAANYANAQNFLTMMLHKDVAPNILTTTDDSALTTALLRTKKGVHDEERDAIIRILLRSSTFTVDIDLPAQGESPLFIAARLNNLAAVTLLVEKGANYDFVATRGPYRGHTVFGIAVYEGNYDVVRYLLEKCTADFTCLFSIETHKKEYNLLDLSLANSKSTALNSHNHQSIYDLLQILWIEKSPEQVRTLINRLIKNENLSELSRWNKFILSHNSKMPETGNTPLHTAVTNGKNTVLRYLVLEIGVPVDSQNLKGETPLHLACRKKRPTTVSELMQLGASPNIPNNENKTSFNLVRELKHEASLRVFIKFCFDIGLELPSATFARAADEELLAKIIEEIIPPPVETPPPQAAVEAPPKRQKNKAKSTTKNKSQETSTSSPPASEPESQTPPQLPALPRLQSSLSHIIWSNLKIRPRPTRYMPNEFTNYLFKEIKDAIETEFRFIHNNPDNFLIIDSLQLLISYYSSLKYFSDIGIISENSPALLFVRELYTFNKSIGLDIDTNLSYWEAEANKIFQALLFPDGTFSLNEAIATKDLDLRYTV